MHNHDSLTFSFSASFAVSHPLEIRVSVCSILEPINGSTIHPTALLCHRWNRDCATAALDYGACDDDGGDGDFLIHRSMMDWLNAAKKNFAVLEAAVVVAAADGDEGCCDGCALVVDNCSCCSFDCYQELMAGTWSGVGGSVQIAGLEIPSIAAGRLILD